MLHWFKHALKTAVLFCLCLVTAQPGYANTNPDQTTINSDIQRLEEVFYDLSSEFYKNASATPDEYPQPIIDVELLLDAVNKLTTANQPTSAIRLIYLNIETIKANLDTDAIFSFIKLLLDKNEWHLANNLHEEIKNEHNQSIISAIEFIFAKYHARRHQWAQVNVLLEDSFAELSEENTSYAYLLNGAALQHLKKHRQAIANYSKVPVTSQYYSYAQLNTAIANIRQGWWTDAHTKIQEQLKQSRKTNKDELTNRLYLVLGYALLQREYYRDARDAFRHIGLDSRYTNRALLGIGLTATSQGDYVGALNALTILKDKKTTDLSVDESYLLIPYVYEKLQQEITVTTAYTEAMNYYQQRINTLEEISSKHISSDYLEYNKESSHLIIQNNSFDYGNRYPESFIKNFQLLKNFLDTASDTRLKNKITKLITQFESTFQNIISDLANERKEYLKSYLNQSRYGLARLYDSSNKTNK